MFLFSLQNRDFIKDCLQNCHWQISRLLRYCKNYTETYPILLLCLQKITMMSPEVELFASDASPRVSRKKTSFCLLQLPVLLGDEGSGITYVDWLPCLARGLSSKPWLLLCCFVVCPLNVCRGFDLKAERFRAVVFGGWGLPGRSLRLPAGRARGVLERRSEGLGSGRRGASAWSRLTRALPRQEWLGPGGLSCIPSLGSAGAWVFLGLLGARAAGFAPGVMVAGRRVGHPAPVLPLGLPSRCLMLGRWLYVRTEDNLTW